MIKRLYCVYAEKKQDFKKKPGHQEHGGGNQAVPR
jgi:hypothetical protein